MESYLPENEYKEFESRQYINPQISVDETNTFIDNLRSAQGQQNQEITTDTQMLGTDVPTNLGGLTGAESYFTSRYQTPQTVSALANLRTTAQANALNQMLQDEQAIWKKRYQDAYRAYQKRSFDRAYSGGGGNTGGNGDGNTSTWDGQTNKEPTDDNFIYWLGQDGNVWAIKNGVSANLGAANMVNGQWDGQPSGSTGSMSGNGTKIDDPNPGGINGNGETPPDVKDYTVDIDEQYKSLPDGWRYIIETATGKDNTVY